MLNGFFEFVVRKAQPYWFRHFTVPDMRVIPASQRIGQKFFVNIRGSIRPFAAIFSMTRINETTIVGNN